MTIKDNRAVVAASCAEIAIIERLAADLKAVPDGTGPTDANIKSAPHIDGYGRANRKVACLAGLISGRPMGTTNIAGLLSSCFSLGCRDGREPGAVSTGSEHGSMQDRRRDTGSGCRIVITSGRPRVKGVLCTAKGKGLDNHSSGRTLSLKSIYEWKESR